MWRQRKVLLFLNLFTKKLQQINFIRFLYNLFNSLPDCSWLRIQGMGAKTSGGVRLAKTN